MGMMTGAYGNPVGENVISGGVTFDRSNQQLLIQQSTENAIIHWDDFSINVNELTKFIQPGSGSSVLNRVVTGNPSALLGSLQSNGKVYLINPNGILVGAGAQINCGSFTASTLDIKNQDFLSGINHFSGDSTAGIQNLGKITTTAGDLILIGRQLTNQGTMESSGKIGMYAGGDVLIPQGDNPSVVLPGTILNEGTLTALEVELRASGENPYALAINHTGKIKATGFVRGEGGRISLVADKGRVKSTGSVIATGETKGGKIQITGDQVGIGGLVDASGTEQGGIVNIGGEWQGKGELKNAQQVKVSDTAVIKAEGAKGEVVIWSEGTTEFYGKASVAGGKGKMEISGKENLIYEGEVDLGGTGSLLFDPTNITVSTANPGGFTQRTVASDLDQFTDNPGESSYITPADLLTLLSSGNVTLQATSDINLTNDVDASASLYLGRSLTLQAGGSIYANSGFDLNLNGGAFTAISTLGGIVIGNGGAATITTLGGAITLTGTAGTVNQTGVGITAASILSSGAGNITITGTGSSTHATTSDNYGVQVNTAGTTITSTSGNIVITGAGGAQTGSGNEGYRQIGGTISTTGGGNLSITGTGSVNGSNDCGGIRILGNGTSTISSNQGTISLTGTGKGTTASNRGILIFDNTGIINILGTGNAAITITGTAGSTAGGFTTEQGVYVLGTTVSVANGDLTIRGTGGVDTGASNQGVALQGSTITSTGTGNILIEGTGSGSGALNNGIGFIGAASTIGGNSTTSNITFRSTSAISDSFSVAAGLGSIKTTGTITFAPMSDSETIGIGTGSTGKLNLDATDLAAIQTGYSSVTIGRTTGTGAVDVRATSWTSDLIVQSGGSTGTVTLNGAITEGSGKNITLVGGGGITNNVGSSALNVSNGGRWLLYSDTNGNISANGLTPGFTGWGVRYPTAALKSGNGFIFFNTPLQNGFSILPLNQELVTNGTFSVLKMGEGIRLVRADGTRDLVQEPLNASLDLPFMRTEGISENNSIFSSIILNMNGSPDEMPLQKGFKRLSSSFEVE